MNTDSRTSPRQPAARLKAVLAGIALVALAVPTALGQDLDYHVPATTTDPVLASGIRDLAGRLLPVYQDEDTSRYLENLSILQMATGNWVSAWDQRQALQERRRGPAVGRDAVLDLYARSRLLRHQEGIAFAQAWSRVFGITVPRLSDPDALALERELKTPAYALRNTLQQQLDRFHGQGRLSIDDCLQLVRAWLEFDAWRNFAPLVPNLVAQDQRSRYQQEDIAVSLSHGLHLTAHLVLPRAAPPHLPAQLLFRVPEPTGDDDEDLAVAAAGNALVIVQLDPPLARLSAGRRAAREKDLMRWIARQPWSNGKVQMVPIAPNHS